ncbi:translation elongation factor-like protein [Candidatus Microgenomates bacterium]|nr:translation elongation factor-like protein [Candidatus Microgenomates bacterium]
MAELQIGVVTHFYNKIGVAIIKMSAPLKIGETIKISGHDQEFTQVVGSMQVEHQEIKEAKKGDEVGLKVDKPVKEKDLVYKVE